jgi:alpha-L-arabinofuranosidase
MIYFSNTEVRPTPAYHVQRLFSVNSGDRYINSTLTVPSGFPGDKDLMHRLGASVVKDSKTGKMFLKLVNALPCELQLTVNGLDIPATARTEGFSGAPEDQKLTIESGQTGQGGSLIVMPPYSFRVIEL